jgi:hypothetical protein
MKMKLIMLMTLGLLMAVFTIPVYADDVPPLPHAFYGNLTINGSPAPTGTKVEAMGEGVRTGIEGNPIVTTEVGKYGSADPLGTKLIVQGYILDGATITFYINDISTGQTALWHSGEVTQLDLSVTVVAPAVTTNAATGIGTTTATLNGRLDSLGSASSVTVSFQWGTTASYGSETSAQIMTAAGSFSASLSGLSPSTTYHFRVKAVGAMTSYGTDQTFTTSAAAGGGAGGALVPTIGTNLFGIQQAFNTSSSGILSQQIQATSTDGKMTITIPASTKCLDKNGDPLTSLTVANVSPPAPPANAYIIGLAYNFGPDGATFYPPFTITWSYDPDDLPEGVAEEDLVIAYYDEAMGQWVELVCKVDTVNNIITASIAHFTTFAIIGKARPAAFTLSALTISPAEVAPGEEVNISLSVANTGGIEGSCTVVLNINGSKEAEKVVTISAGSSQTVSFSVTKELAGSYNVAVNGLSGSFTVLTPPEPTPTPSEPTPTPIPAQAAFSVSSLSILPSEVLVGETVTISVSVTNTGGQSDTYKVNLKIDGAVVATKELTVAAGKSESVSFTTSKDAAGIYSVDVNGLTGSFTVKPLAPPPPPSKPNWPLIGGIVGGAIVIGLLIYLLTRRRAY